MQREKIEKMKREKVVRELKKQCEKVHRESSMRKQSEKVREHRERSQ